MRCAWSASREMRPGSPSGQRRRRQPCRALAAAAVLLANSAAAGVDFRQQAGELLMEQLSRSGVALSTSYVTELARRNKMAVGDTRRKLQALLDSAVSSQGKSTRWDSVIAGLGGEEVSDKKTDRFLREATNAARKAMAGEGAYELTKLLERAASKAKISVEDGKLILRRALSPGAGVASDAAVADLPGKIGIRVTAENEIRPSYTPQITFFFRTDDDAFIRERLSHMHEGVVTSLVDLLPSLASVKWAVAEASPVLAPDVVLVLTLDTFELRGSPNLRALPYATGSIMLQRVDNGSVILLQSVEFISKSEVRDHDIELALFASEMAAETTGILGRFLGN